jgi:hypothetical protein
VLAGGYWVNEKIRIAVVANHEAGYLDHCRRYALAAASA